MRSTNPAMATKFGVNRAIPRPKTIIAVKIGLRTQPNTPLRTSVVVSLGIDTDPPRVTHVELGVDRRGDTDHRDRGACGLNPQCVQDAKRRHDAEQLQDRREGRHTHRHDEPDTGRPLDRTRATG